MGIKKIFSLDWIKNLGKDKSAPEAPQFDFSVNPNGLTAGQVKTLKLLAKQELPPLIFAKSVDGQNWPAFESVNQLLTAIALDQDNPKQGIARRYLRDIAAAAKGFANCLNSQETGDNRISDLSKTLVDVSLELERATKFLANENQITDLLQATTGERFKFLQDMEQNRLRLAAKAVKEYVMTLPDEAINLLVKEVRKCDPRSVPFLQDIFEIEEPTDLKSKSVEWSWAPNANPRPSQEIQLGLKQIQKALARLSSPDSLRLKLALEKVELALLVDQETKETN